MLKKICIYCRYILKLVYNLKGGGVQYLKTSYSTADLEIFHLRTDCKSL